MRSGLPGVWACFIWLVCLLAIVVLVSGYRGGAVGFSGNLLLFVGHCLFGNKFLIIQKKKKDI